MRLAQHVAAAPDGLDEVAPFRGVGELLAQLADEDVDDLQLRLVHAAIEVVEEHFLGERGALAQAEQLENAIFLAGEMERLALDLDHAAIEIDQELAGAYHGFRMTLRPPADRLDTGDQLAPVERLGEEIVGPEAETLDLVVELAET